MDAILQITEKGLTIDTVLQGRLIQLHIENTMIKFYHQNYQSKALSIFDYSSNRAT